MLAIVTLFSTGCSDKDDSHPARLHITVESDCRNEGSVRIWVNGIERERIAPGGVLILPIDAGEHHLYAVNDRGRKWDRRFTVTRLESALWLSCQ